MSVWLQSLGVPLAGVPCGEDPRYRDEFALIKGEIEKLQGTDFARVWDLGKDLLATCARDLRIAGYLIPAALFTGGFPRLLEAVRGYRIVAEQYWDDCHPRQTAPRIAALRWLNHPRIESFARRFATEISKEEMESLWEEVEGINRIARDKLGEEGPVWTVLNPWMLETLRPLSAPPAPISPPSKGAREESPATGGSPPISASPSAIASDREVAAATRSIRDYLRQQGAELHAAYFTRALRWGGIASPPYEGGRTRIPPPRPGGRSELEKARSAGDWTGVLRVCEGLFLEPGGPFDLDLQASSAEAARALGRHDLAEFIAGQTILLVRRFPDLPRLAFEDGRPFASPATRQWLKEQQGGAETGAEKGGWERTLDERMKTARESLRCKGLEEGLALLKGFPVPGERERFQLRLAQARLCLEGGCPEVALPLLEELHREIVARSLHLWDEETAMDVWTALLEACRGFEGERDELKPLADEVRAQICRTDPQKAIGLL